MRTFIWLVAAGLAWLGLLQLSALLGFPPQLVSLARSCYIGTFSIFMMLELRREETDVHQFSSSLRVADIGWFLVPLSTVVVLAGFSRDLILTPKVIATIGVFYSCQLCLLFMREKLGKMRMAAWDLAPPLVLVVLIFSPEAVLITAIFCVIFLAALLWQGGSKTKSGGVADSLIMQLPSLCLAPALLIAIRDQVDFGANISRAHIETFGMIVNGLGAALWTALVMRASQHLSRWSSILWFAGSVSAGLSLLISHSLISSAVAILVAEMIRGALWLGMTQFLRTSTRWVGFSINLLGTALPFGALWVARLGFDVNHMMPVYAAFHIAVPLTLWLRTHVNQTTRAE